MPPITSAYNLLGTRTRPYKFVGVPVNGTSGTLAGIANPGELLIDTTVGTGKLYQNTNTKASPTWTSVGSQT